MNSHGHPYLLRCTEPPDHASRHVLAPAHRILWEQIHGVPAPSRVAHLRPVDGNWMNLEPSNWELVSLRQTRQEQAKRLHPETHKFCKECGAYLDLKDFAERRNTCKDCWKERLRNNTQKQRDHVREFNCYIVDRKHYHLLDRASAMDYVFNMRFRQLRKDNPDDKRYAAAVAHEREMLHRAVQYGLEANDD